VSSTRLRYTRARDPHPQMGGENCPPPSGSTIPAPDARVRADFVPILDTAGSHTVRVLDLFPDTAAVQDGELTLGGVSTTALAREFGTPLVVYCERTIVAQAREYQRVVPDGTVLYGTKAFPNVALLRLLARLGLGADVSTLGELRFALAA